MWINTPVQIASGEWIARLLWEGSEQPNLSGCELEKGNTEGRLPRYPRESGALLSGLVLKRTIRNKKCEEIFAEMARRFYGF